MNAILRILAWTLAVVLVALPVVAVVNGWIGADRWPLRTLRVQGELTRVDGATLQKTLLPFAQRGFFAVRLADAQAAVAKLPWVEHAEVRKRWPDMLEVRIVEHQPFARWGKDRLLSEEGQLFPAAGIAIPKGLPHLDGPDTRVAAVVALYNESQALFAPSGIVVRGLALDRRGSWSLQLSGGTDVVVGSSEARLRLGRFARLLPQLLSQKQLPLARADLRYTNGFALVWGTKPGLGTRDSGLGPGTRQSDSAAAVAASDSKLPLRISASARSVSGSTATFSRVPSPESRVPAQYAQATNT